VARAWSTRRRVAAESRRAARAPTSHRGDLAGGMVVIVPVGCESARVGGREARALRPTPGGWTMRKFVTFLPDEGPTSARPRP
jgi:hypothetical protein